MQLLGPNTFIWTNCEMTLEVIPEMFARYLTDCEMGAFKVDMHFYFLYSALYPFSDFLDLLKKSCSDSSELMGTEK